jgi:DNA-binding response OmpR family regulator
MPTILIVEDEPKLRELLRGYFERDGMTVLTAATGAEGLSLALTAKPDLVVLDLGLPDIPGESVVREIRRSSQLPVLMLTAKADEGDRIRGLELGADDYVTKPFSPRELVLRVRAISRRSTTDGLHGSVGRRSFGAATLVIDEPRRQAIVREEVADLTPTEWGVLLALATTPGRVYSRQELMNRARGHEFEGYERSIDSHIKNLRRKVEEDPHQPRIVLTVLGGGYRLGLAPDG